MVETSIPQKWSIVRMCRVIPIGLGWSGWFVALFCVCIAPLSVSSHSSLVTNEPCHRSHIEIYFIPLYILGANR
jgi:hypothetical protein